MNPLDAKLILDALDKWFDEQDARWERRFAEQDAAWDRLLPPRSGTWATREQRDTAIALGVVNLEQHGEAPSIVADNWGGLFEPPAHTSEERDLDLRMGIREQIPTVQFDAVVDDDNWGGSFDLSDSLPIAAVELGTGDFEQSGASQVVVADSWGGLFNEVPIFTHELVPTLDTNSTPVYAAPASTPSTIMTHKVSSAEGMFRIPRIPRRRGRGPFPRLGRLQLRQLPVRLPHHLRPRKRPRPRRDSHAPTFWRRIRGRHRRRWVPRILVVRVRLQRLRADARPQHLSAIRHRARAPPRRGRGLLGCVHFGPLDRVGQALATTAAFDTDAVTEAGVQPDAVGAVGGRHLARIVAAGHAPSICSTVCPVGGLCVLNPNMVADLALVNSNDCVSGWLSVNIPSSACFNPATSSMSTVLAFAPATLNEAHHLDPAIEALQLPAALRSLPALLHAKCSRYCPYMPTFPATSVLAWSC